MRKMVLAALAATMGCGPVSAAVSYSFANSYGSFTYDSADFVTGEVFTNGRYSSCTTTGISAICGSKYDELNALFASGAYNQVGFGYTSTSGASYAGYTYFDATAFRTTGLHTPVPGGGEGTLIVSLSPAPEPASWAMMVGGFGAIGAAMRRRKVAVSFN